MKCCNADALVNSVMTTWKESKLDHSISKVFQRIKPILCNIIEARGGNNFVEMKRGKKHENIKLEDVIVQMQKEEENNGDNSLRDIMAIEDEDNMDVITFEDDNI